MTVTTHIRSRPDNATGHWRYIYFHGQRFARLDRFESIHGPAIRPRSWLMSLSSIVFLFAPEAHLLDIEKFYVDNSVARHVWKRHITKLQDEWIEFVLYVSPLTYGMAPQMIEYSPVQATVM